ncbi:hypothetical protein ACFPM0_29500 [Pseudonocardia sulfidoxydans]
MPPPTTEVVAGQALHGADSVIEATQVSGCLSALLRGSVTQPR